MGEHDVESAADGARTRAFTRAILEEIRVLESMIERGLIETSPQRVGVEQEMFLIDAEGRAAPVAESLLDTLTDRHFTTELARFNLEVNLDPEPLDGHFLQRLEDKLQRALDTATAAAAPLGASVLLTGILPSLSRDDLSLDNLSPGPRFRLLNDAISRARGGAITVVIDGLDAFEITQDNVMLEGANTSLQLHLQVSPAEGAHLYNLMQLTAAPLLAAATNSPCLLGRRLWHETRVAVFERAVDARSGVQVARGNPPRVCFGETWLGDSLVEIFHDNAARYPTIMTRATEPEPAARVARGEAPALSALCLHNGTVWRWNRPCYGVADGRATLRIESRVLPAGPTIIDETANAALFYGVLFAMKDCARDVPARLPFAAAKANFLAAAQHGLDAEFTWLDRRRVGARALLLEELLPRARLGLAQVGVPTRDIDRYLGTVTERVETRRTGSAWLLDAIGERDGPGPALWREVVLLMAENQRRGDPVHRWESAALPPRLGRATRASGTVSEIMTRDVFTVRPDDVIDLASSVMSWKHVRHIPVETEDGELVGLLTAREILGARERHSVATEADTAIAVRTIMHGEPPTIDPRAPLTEAMRRLLTNDSGCLLVTSDGRLLGIVTERDFVRVALELLERA